MSRTLPTVLLLMLAASWQGLAWAAEADPEVSAWLDKMGRALREQNYEGIFTYMRGYRFDTVKVVHTFADGEEIERLVHLNGEQREVVRHGDEIICRHERSDHVDLDHEVPLGPFTHAFNENLANYQSLYDFTLRGKDRVAGRPTVKLEITPSNDDRYGYRLWLDEATGLLLQSHLVNRGRVLEVFQFSRVDIGETIDEAQFASTLGEDAIEHRLTPIEPVTEQHTQKPQWRVAWLPNGFRRVISPSPDRILYSDGIATFSVFVERNGGEQLGELDTHMGGTVVITRRLKGSAQQITVVGEVPIDTARKVAESVEPVIY